MLDTKYFPGGWLNVRCLRCQGKSLKPAQEMVTLQATCVLHLVTRGSSQDKAVPSAFIPSPKATPGLPLRWEPRSETNEPLTMRLG